jgi:hypothetical protein
MNFKKWLESNQTLLQNLESLKPQFAMAAQKVYDDWQEDEYDDYNGGGICQDIAEEIATVINQHMPDVNVGTVSSSCGEQHVFVILHNDLEGYSVDIPYYVYETGGGYSWKKIKGVKFLADHISIEKMHYSDAKIALEDPY